MPPKIIGPRTELPPMTRALLLMFCSALLCCPIVSAQLAAELRQIAAKASLGPEAVAGIAVYDAHTGIPIYESAADVPLAPASNQKLLTSAAAVKILGPAFAFRTALHQTPEGLLILVGSGDPALGDPEVLKELSPPLQTEDVLTGLASAAAAQILSARGLVIDDRVFDRELIHPDWPADQLDRWYCAPVQGINIHANVLAFYPSPGDGAGPTATIEPDAPWIEMVNRAEAISEGRNAVWVQRSETDDRYTLRGKIRTPFQSPIEVSVQQPALLAGRLVADRMDRAGVSFSEPPRLAESHDRFELSEPPLAVWSTALDDTLYRCNYDSMNLYAEALLKRVGHEVTGERGG
jgi:D-alanyl-D-alanine carboxypeptidase/D-alanyl-D-alanine-endopeptidase (penicillin-binding protein 4)